MTISTTDTRVRSSRQLTEKALYAEMGRRKNNKERVRTGEKPARSKSWVAAGMSQDQMIDVIAGLTIPVEFKNRVVDVSLKS